MKTLQEISIIIPTYKSPEALELCLKSIIKSQINSNQIIVVVDGFYEINKLVLQKYEQFIEILNLEYNVGVAKATNLGVYNAIYENILIINDDNVVSNNFDIDLSLLDTINKVYAINQIEPSPSIFSQFRIKDLGRDPKTFDLENLRVYEHKISEDRINSTGSTLPIYMRKDDFMRVGGWDSNYPNSWVSDCDFFYKCLLSGMKMLRTYNTHFYHFVSLGTTSTPEDAQNKIILEQEDHEYFKYKWGGYMVRGKYNEINVRI